MSDRLKTEQRIENPDDFYQRLIEMHRSLSDEQSHALNARLILLLANHIGDRAALDEALSMALEVIETDPEPAAD